MSDLTPEFVERQRLVLVNRMIELRETLANGLETKSEEPGDYADKAATLVELTCISSLQEKIFIELADIDAALTRIQRGSYGICELTGQPISIERLEASPTARFSIQAQVRVERRRRWA